MASRCSHPPSRRRALLFALLLPACAAAPLATSATAAADYGRVADWLFDQYVLQAVTVARFNADRVRPEAGQAIDAERPQLLRFLDRHRPAFLQALAPIVREHLPEADAAVLAARIATPPVRLEPQLMTRLAAIDADFRQNEQRVLRAMTFELNLLADQIVQNSRRTP
jgi:hypothetical protein